MTIKKEWSKYYKILAGTVFDMGFQKITLVVEIRTSIFKIVPVSQTVPLKERTNVIYFNLILKELPQLSEECYMELFNPTIHNKPSIPNEDNFHLRRIPLMDTVCEQFPNMRFNLDIKENNDELIHKVR